MPKAESGRFAALASRHTNGKESPKINSLKHCIQCNLLFESRLIASTKVACAHVFQAVENVAGHLVLCGVITQTSMNSLDKVQEIILPNLKRLSEEPVDILNAGTQPGSDAANR